MANTQKHYRRLRGTGYRRLVPVWAMLLLFFVIGIFVLLLRGRRVQLWLGDDHLLQVEWDGYKEYYKRFRYSDIQAISIRRTAEGFIMMILLGSLTVLFSTFLLSVDDPAGRWILIVIAGFFGILFIGSVVAGATCQCHLQTAVQVEHLPSLNRLRRAQKALTQLRELITSAQGQRSPVASPQPETGYTEPGRSEPTPALS
jgi:hypothetical protein